MIWCFGFFFLWLLCDFDEESQQQCEMLRMTTMVAKTVQRPDRNYKDGVGPRMESQPKYFKYLKYFKKIKKLKQKNIISPVF